MSVFDETAFGPTTLRERARLAHLDRQAEADAHLNFLIEDLCVRVLEEDPDGVDWDNVVTTLVTANFQVAGLHFRITTQVMGKSTGGPSDRNSMSNNAVVGIHEYEKVTTYVRLGKNDFQFVTLADLGKLIEDRGEAKETTGPRYGSFGAPADRGGH